MSVSAVSFIEMLKALPQSIKTIMLLHSTFAYNELLRMYGNDKKGITTQGSLTNTSLNSTFLSANDAISHKISGPLLVATTVSSTIVSPQKNNRRGEESAHVK